MPHDFFLSYAQADGSPLIKKFFNDLCDYVRRISGRLRSEVVGFYEEPDYLRGSDWSGDQTKALQESRTMVCLLSPAYFYSERAGKEWEIFERRRRESFGKGAPRGEGAISLAQIIKPVVWIPWQGPVPRAINEILNNPDRLYQARALTMMLKTPGGSLSEYNEIVKVLAHQIIEQADQPSLPPLDPFPKMEEVPTFHIWDDPNESFSQGETGSHKQKRYMLDGEFIGKVTETGGDAGLSRVPLSRNSQEDTSPPSNRTVDPPSSPAESSEPAFKYKVVIVDDDLPFVDFLTSSMFTGFEVKSDNTTETVERMLASSWPEPIPDLFVIDLDLKSEISGLDLIKTLGADRRITSSIVAKSRKNEDLVKAIKAGAVAFPEFNVEETLRRLAGYGRNRWLHRYGKNFQHDKKREWRPIFLSYSTKDREIATGLRNQIEALGIGVWYALDDFQVGERWQTRVDEIINEVNIFLALFTEHYLPSYGILELAQFRLRLKEAPPGKLLLVPIVHAEISKLEKQAVFCDVRGECQFINIADDFIGGLQRLLRVLQNGAPI
jgi:ActR/RegA family two-component response regulator